jgi:hypothetical protein
MSEHKFRLVILSEAKDLLFCQRMRQQVLRFAQDDKSFLRGVSDGS